MATMLRLREILIDKFGYSPELIVPGVSLVGLNMDSMTAVEFSFEIESAFKVRLQSDFPMTITLAEIEGLLDQFLKKSDPA